MKNEIFFDDDEKNLTQQQQQEENTFAEGPSDDDADGDTRTEKLFLIPSSSMCVSCVDCFQQVPEMERKKCPKKAFRENVGSKFCVYYKINSNWIQVKHVFIMFVLTQRSSSTKQHTLASRTNINCCYFSLSFDRYQKTPSHALDCLSNPPQQ